MALARAARSKTRFDSCNERDQEQSSVDGSIRDVQSPRMRMHTSTDQFDPELQNQEAANHLSSRNSTASVIAKRKATGIRKQGSDTFDEQ